MYKNNWTLPENGKLAAFVLERMHTCSCLYDDHITFKPDGSANFCSYTVIPPIVINGKENKEFLKIFNAFKNGGPLGIARYYGMNEKAIYGVLMDKGPCGLCQTAVKGNKKN